jgi:uncharacterized RDD family membrane protein YckC
VLDTVVAAETPEGILLELRPAGLSARCYAFMVDWALRLAILYAAAMLAAVAGGVGIALWLILFFALEWLYPVFFEMALSGATPGKRAFGLRVVMDNGLPVTAAAAMTRNLLRAADFLPFGYAFAIVSMLVRRDCKRLGDVAAATMVVHEPRAVPRVDIAPVAPVAPIRPLALDDQAAIVALALRAPRLTRERLDELAALAAPVSGDAGRSGPAVTRRVLGVGHWILGRRDGAHGAPATLRQAQGRRARATGSGCGAEPHVR